MLWGVFGIESGMDFPLLFMIVRNFCSLPENSLVCDRTNVVRERTRFLDPRK